MDSEAVSKVQPEALELLFKLADRLEQEPEWDGHELIGVLKAFAKENGVKMGAVMFPARVALTGLSGGPDPFLRLFPAGPGGNRKENPFLFPGLIPAGISFLFKRSGRFPERFLFTKGHFPNSRKMPCPFLRPALKKTGFS